MANQTVTNYQTHLTQFLTYVLKFMIYQSNKLLDQQLSQKNLIQTRKHVNLTPKQQTYINSLRYAQTFKLSKQSNNPQLTYSDADWLAELYGFTLNTKAFLVTIELLGNQEQVKIWRQLILNGKVIGGYGQTELGHGSNVQQLETEAIFNQENQSFILNSPKVTSVKFWPGCFGLFSTHCVIQAKTKVKQNNIGIQTFILPMRDINLNPLPGIQSGDIGPKIGFIKVDNGYLKINNVQIPKQNMLSKYVQIQANGTVHGLQNKQAIKYGYGSMLNLRIKLVIGFAMAYTYQPAVIQYQILSENNLIKQNKLVKNRLIEIMCVGLGQILSNLYVYKLFIQFLDNLKTKNYQKADKLLISCHIISSTFKALSSWKCEETSRQCTTMNQYSSFQSSFLPKYFTDCIPSVTYQGDNSVLLQQTAKYILIKQKQNQLTKPSLVCNIDNFSEIIKILRFITSSQIRILKALLQKQVQSGKPFQTVWNQIYQSRILSVSRLWGKLTFIQTSISTISTNTSIQKHKQFFIKIVKVFVSVLIKETPEVVFYGFKINGVDNVAEIFVEDQIQVLKDINRPVKREAEDIKYQTRGNQQVADWIYSKL